MPKEFFDVVVIGAGAAGLMAASQAGQRGLKTLLLDHSDKIGEKIRISGGGRCNFTNLGASPKNYISQNPHFAISALSRYTQHDFIKLVESYKIAFHEKTLGQLFCDGSSSQIINMLTSECEKANVYIKLGCKVVNVGKGDRFTISTTLGDFDCTSLIVATGGLSIPKLGATDFAYKIAQQFGIQIVQPKPALVPLTVGGTDLEIFKSLSGISMDSIVSYNKVSFRESILFTHRGLSGPAILQISSYLNSENEVISMNLLPDQSLIEVFKKDKNSKMLLANFLKEFFPNRFIDVWGVNKIESKKLTDCSNKYLEQIGAELNDFKVSVQGNEGYLKAEVTAGGIDTKELSSKTMESKKVPNLYFIGECVDVTGWLGGYNFQWAWSSGYVAGHSA